MSKYTVYYNEKQQMYRELAFAWKAWSEDRYLSAEQKKGMALFFKQLGKRFGLLQLFKEIGVI